MRGEYLIMRGKHAEAVPLLEDCLHETPRTRTAWARGHGVLAYACNRLGQYDRARAACQRVFEHADPRDFEFPLLNMVVQTEFAVAEAGLGRVDAAGAEIARLRARHGSSQNPLVRGELLEAAFEIALIARDVAEARAQLAHIEATYRPLSIPSLAQYCEALTARLGQLEHGGNASLAPPCAASDDSDGLYGSLDELITRRGMPLQSLVQRALRLFAASAGASEGALYVVDAAGTPHLNATLSGKEPSAVAQRWMIERLAAELEDERTVLQTEADPSQLPWNVMQEGSRTYRMLVLTGFDGVVLALVLLSREGGAPGQTPSSLLKTVTERLQEALGEERSAASFSRNRDSG
jgi:transcriptional regulator with XRE-family HTH domain